MGWVWVWAVTSFARDSEGKSEWKVGINGDDGRQENSLRTVR